MSPYPLLGLLALHTAPAPVGLTAPSLRVHDLATLTGAEARQLAGRRAVYRAHIESEPDGDSLDGWRYDCPGNGEQLRRLWLRDGDDLAAEVALRGSGLLLVEATLQRIVHAPAKGVDGSSLPALVE
jgi:hypothetical protein